MLILASASPRRQELLSLITKDFEIIAADVDESLAENVPPAEVVEMLALKKAKAVAALRPEAVIIGADTVVAIDGEILGKPVDEDDAKRMLKRLSGRTHLVLTGICIISRDFCEVFSQSTEVEFLKLDEREIKDYIASGEPMDKAGAYGIQGGAALFVAGIRGDYYNVMGLPVAELNRRLQRLEIINQRDAGPTRSAYPQ